MSLSSTTASLPKTNMRYYSFEVGLLILFVQHHSLKFEFPVNVVGSPVEVLVSLWDREMSEFCTQLLSVTELTG